MLIIECMISWFFSSIFLNKKETILKRHFSAETKAKHQLVMMEGSHVQRQEWSIWKPATLNTLDVIK